MTITQFAGSKSNHCKTVAIALSLSIAALLAAAASSAQSLSVRYGFDGAFVDGRWSPVRIDVSAGSEPFSGHVEIEIPRTTLLSIEPTYVQLSAFVDVESRATKRLWLSVPLQSTPYSMVVRLVNASGQTVATEEISLREGATPGRLALVLDPSGDRWTWLSQGNDGSAPFLATATIQRADDVPDDALALSSASAIIVKDDFPLGSLSPGRLAALLDYVRLGGSLVLTGGSTPPSIPKAIADQLPIVPTGRVVPIQAGDSMVPSWELDVPFQAAIRFHDGFPLVASAHLGKGRLTYIAVNPVLQISRSLLPADVWSEGLAGGEERLWSSMSPTRQEELWRVLSRARIETRLPFPLAATLAAYTAAALVATWLARRQTRAFIATIGLIGAASLATHLIASIYSISDRAGYAELQIAQAITDGVAVSRTFGMVASSTPVPFPLDVHASASPPFPAASVRASIAADVTPGGIRFSSVDPGTSVRFVHETLETFPISTQIEQGERARLNIVNNGDAPLHHAYIVGRNWYAPIGTIEAKDAVSIEAPRVVEGSSSFVTLSVQSHLERLSGSERPSSLEARIISFAVSQALDDASLRGRRDVPILVALAQSSDVVRLDPAGPAIRRRVIIAPFFEETLGGRHAN